MNNIPHWLAFCLSLSVILGSCSDNQTSDNEQSSSEPDSISSMNTENPESNNLSEQSPEQLISINGNSLSEEQVNELIRTYGVKPQPGDYWYDAASGLYGVNGYQAFGFMKAGHDFGKMKTDVSKGNTGVFVNGRELPETEWMVWIQLIGSYIAPGKYWLDGQGNAGNEGDPNPTTNLYAAAQQNAYRGQGAGDNFWTSRFSAGNYNADNSQGYVSVPGHGPVGYGF